MGTVTDGTWSVDQTRPLPSWTITLDKVFESGETVVESDYATKFFFKFKNESGQLEVTMALTFADYKTMIEAQ